MPNLFNTATGFTDELANLIASQKIGSGAGLLPKLGQALRRGLYAALAASGALETATTTTLKALSLTDINETLALDGVATLRVTILDRGDGKPALAEFAPSSSATDDGSFIHKPSDAGSSNGRWLVTSALDRASTRPGHSTSASNPAVTNDIAHGYSAGMTWKNTATGEVFVCVDSTATAAVWKTIVPIKVNSAPAAAAKRVTATTTKTMPSGLALTLPANFPVGGRISYHAMFKVAGSNGSDTGAFSVETSSGVVLSEHAAYDMVNDDVISLKGDYIVEVTGASGKLSGTSIEVREGQAPDIAAVTDEALDLSAARTVGPYITLSSTNAGNLVDVRRFDAEAWSLP